jgi:hypothetical protein
MDILFSNRLNRPSGPNASTTSHDNVDTMLDDPDAQDTMSENVIGKLETELKWERVRGGNGERIRKRTVGVGKNEEANGRREGMYEGNHRDL